MRRKKMFSMKSMLNMPKIMPTTKDLLGNDFKDLGIQGWKPKKRRRKGFKSIAKLLKDV